MKLAHLAIASAFILSLAQPARAQQFGSGGMGMTGGGSGFNNSGIGNVGVSGMFGNRNLGSTVGGRNSSFRGGNQGIGRVLRRPPLTSYPTVSGFWDRKRTWHRPSSFRPRPGNSWTS